MSWYSELSWKPDRRLREFGEFLAERGTPLQRVPGTAGAQISTYVATTHIGTIQLTGVRNSWAVYLKPVGCDTYVDVVDWKACESGRKPGFMARQTSQTSVDWLTELLAQPALPVIDKQCLAAVSSQRKQDVMSWRKLWLLTVIGVAVLVFLGYQMAATGSAVTAGFFGISFSAILALHLNQYQLRKHSRRNSPGDHRRTV